MLKVGMVGTGGISNAHILGWKQVPEAQITSVCDIRRDKAESAAAEAGGARVWTDFEAMLAAERFDIIDICLPTFLHADFSVKALNAGCNVLSEKPVSLKREDVRRIYAAAEANGKHFMVAQVLRFWREYEALKEAIDSGRYGKLLSGRMIRLGNCPAWSWGNWMKDPDRSGLVPFDLHIHDLDWMVYALGKPQNMICHRARSGDQDYFTVVYEYPGFFIDAEAAWFDCNYRFQSSYRFQFEEAVMEFKEGALTIFHRDGSVSTLDEEENAAENGINLPKSNAYYNEIRYFTDRVLDGKPCDKVRPEQLETVLDLIAALEK